MAAFSDYEVSLNITDIMDSDNVADLLDGDALAYMGEQVVERYQADLESRSEWTTRMEEAMRLALQIAEEKTFPWEGAANVKYPLLTTAAMQFAARAYPQLIPSRTLVQMRVTGEDPDGAKAERGERISQHMSYQLLEEMEGWEDDMDRALLTLPIMGCIFKKTYYDPTEDRNVSELVYPWDLVFDYWAKDVDSCSRKTHVLRLTPNQIHERVMSGLYIEADLDNSQPTEPQETLKADVEGTTPYVDEDAPRRVLEQHCLWDLDGDGYKEPYIVTVDEKSREVFRIVPRFSDSDVIFDTDGEEVAKIKSEEFFTQYVFIHDPNGGNLGLGFGTFLGPINETINTLINQLLDAGTLATLQAGFLGSGLRIKGGWQRFEPGEWKVVRTAGTEIKNNVVPLPVKDPSSTLFSLLQMLIQSGERLATVTDALVGENPPANQPAATTLAVIEQGLKVFTAVYKRIHRAMTREFRKLYKLNARYIDAERYFTILDDPDLEQGSVDGTDYMGDPTDVQPSADPNLATEQQKTARAQAVAQLVPLGVNPQAALKLNLEALGLNQKQMEEALTPPPPPPPPPEVQKIQAEIEQDKANFQLKVQEMQAEFQMDAQKAQIETAKMQQELEMAKQQHVLEMEKLRAEIQKIMADIQRTNAQAKAAAQRPAPAQGAK